MMATTMATALAFTPLWAADNEPVKRLNDAAVVFSEVMATPDKGIPQELLEKAHCIVIVPDLKPAAFVAGEPSVAAGPVGRTVTAQRDAQMRADILSWSRTQGLFAGVALERTN